MTQTTRTRLIVTVVAMLAAYALSLILIGSAAGFDHGAAKWLIAGGLSALAVGMLASVALRVVVFVVDASGRKLWWANASGTERGVRTGSLVIRVGMAIFVWYVALRTLR